MSANPFIERAANILAALALDCPPAPDPHRAAALRLEEAGLLNRPVETVYAAHPIQVRRAGLMVELDVASLVRALFCELADQAAEDPDGVIEQLTEISRLSGSARAEHTLDGRGHAVHARDEQLDELLDGLGGTGQHLTSEAAWQLGNLLIQLAGPRLPHQRSAA